jgi:hypothetical protein
LRRIGGSCWDIGGPRDRTFPLEDDLGRSEGSYHIEIRTYELTRVDDLDHHDDNLEDEMEMLSISR